MRLLATHVIHHSSGNKYIRLYHGDLAAIPASDGVDLLVVSAFPNDYIPTATSLVGALHRKGVSVLELSRDKEVDLRSAFSSWLSRDLSCRFPEAGFRRILCFEACRTAPAEAVGDIFRAMMPFALGEQPVRSVAMPVLAAGDRGFDAEVMLRAIFGAAVHWLAGGLPVQTIKLVIYDAELVGSLGEVFTKLSAAASSASETASQPVGNPQTGYHFFVSYAHDDLSEVDVLVEALRVANPALRVFQDKLELNVGESWQTELDSALESCQHVIAVYSPSYLNSKMCIEEFNMARLRHRESPSPVLTPIYLKSAALPLYMRALQYLDCREADRKLLATASEKLAARFT